MLPFNFSSALISVAFCSENAFSRSTMLDSHCTTFLLLCPGLRASASMIRSRSTIWLSSVSATFARSRKVATYPPREFVPDSECLLSPAHRILL